MFFFEAGCRLLYLTNHVADLQALILIRNDTNKRTRAEMLPAAVIRVTRPGLDDEIRIAESLGVLPARMAHCRVLYSFGIIAAWGTMVKEENEITIASPVLNYQGWIYAGRAGTMGVCALPSEERVFDEHAFSAKGTPSLLISKMFQRSVRLEEIFMNSSTANYTKIYEFVIFENI